MSRRERGALVVAVGLSLALLMPFCLRLGGSLEEVAGLAPVVLDWQYPPDTRIAQETMRGGVRFRSSPQLPVWGVVGRDGAYGAIMIDGHIGALGFYPSRFAASLGGLIAARVLSMLGAAAMLLMVFFLGRRLFGPLGGWLAVVVAGTSPLLMVAHFWTRPDEQGAFLWPGVALLALLRHAATGRRRWIIVAGLLLGLALAVKNTALWSVVAMGVAMLTMRLWPRLSIWGWLVLGVSAALPLLPQAAFVLLAPSSGMLGVRLDSVPVPWEAFTDERVRFFSQEFVNAFGGLGSMLGRFIDGRADLPGGPLPGMRLVLLAGVLGLVVVAFRRGTPKAARAYAVALVVVLVEYVGFYYMGQSMFLLLTPWVPLGFAGVVALAWRGSGGLPRPWQRRAAQGALLLVGALFMVNQGLQLFRLEQAASRTSNSLFDRQSQVELARDLMARQITRPWTMTYAVAGVLELDSGGVLRPRHAWPIFSDRCGPRYPKEQHDAAWHRVYELMGPGTHQVILTPNAVLLEISPCRDGHGMVSSFYRTAQARGGQVRSLRRYHATSGGVAFELLELTLPPTPASAAASQGSSAPAPASRPSTQGASGTRVRLAPAAARSR